MIDLTRRTILGSLLAGSIILPGTPVLALASNRYRTVIELQNDLYAADNRVKAQKAATPGMIARDPAHRALLAAEKVDDRTNAMIVYLLDQFNGSDLTSQATLINLTILMRRRISVDVMNEEELNKVEDAVVVIAVMTHLMTFQKAAINAQNIPAFTAFTDRYKNIILQTTHTPLEGDDPDYMSRTLRAYREEAGVTRVQL